MSDVTSIGQTLSIVYGLGWFVSLACDVAILTVVATVVRRHRPDAYQGLLAWAIGSLVVALVMRIAAFLSSFFGHGVEGVLSMQIVMSILGTTLHVALVIVLLRAIVKLAQPPKPPVTPAQPPYR